MVAASSILCYGMIVDVTGVDSPYKEYVDEWNEDVPDGGDNAIDQVCNNAGGSGR